MKIVFNIIIFLFLFSSSLYAQPRTILGLYDSTEEFNIQEDYNLIHNNASMVLNHLGFKVRYHDINQGLPEEGALQDVYGILTWFLDSKMVNARNYLQWLIKQIEQERKVVILDSLGAYEDSMTNKEVSIDAVESIFKALQLEYRGNWTDNPFMIEVLEKDSRVVEFERTLEGEAGSYAHIISAHPDNKVYLKLGRTDKEDSESAAVVTTSKGGVAFQGYVLLIDYFSSQMRWRLNPFYFFEEAFGIVGQPRYDTTTLFGKRIFYSHIDGDGIRNFSELGNRKSSGEVIYESILKKYALPTTVSFISAEIDPQYLGSSDIVALAQKMLKLDHVEAGVHGFTHPLDWKRQFTAFAIEGYSVEHEGEEDFNALYPKAKKVIVEKDVYLKREIEDVVKYTNDHLVFPGKKVMVLQWTGNCEPPKEAIDITDRLGIKNINGGDTRLDHFTPSYTTVAPLARQIGGRLQIYSSSANENIYTNGWQGPFYGFRYLTETFQQTEYPSLVDNIPRRVTPINIYYHFYSGEKKISLEALQSVYDYALSQDIIPIFTSEYLSVVDGFFSGKIQRLNDDGWELTNYGLCRTVRLDRSSQWPDLEKSQGIIGYFFWEQYLYIHLKEGNKAILYLSDKPSKKIYLKSASGIVSEWQVDSKKIMFMAKGFKEHYYILANMKPNTSYEVLINFLGKQREERKKIRSNEEGDLKVSLNGAGEMKVEVR